MATTDLRFATLAASNSALLFGDDGTTPQWAVSAAVVLPWCKGSGAGDVGVAIQAAAVLPLITPAGSSVLGIAAQAAVMLPAIVPAAVGLAQDVVAAVAVAQATDAVVAAAAGVYDSAVSRGPACDLPVTAQAAAGCGVGAVTTMRPAARVVTAKALDFGVAQPAQAAARGVQIDTAHTSAAATMRQIDATRRHAGARYVHANQHTRGVVVHATHSDARTAGVDGRFKQCDLSHAARVRVGVAARAAAPSHIAMPGRCRPASRLPLVLLGVTRDAVRPPAGLSVMPDTGPTPNTCCGPRTPDLRFVVPLPASPHLVFRCDRQLLLAVIVPKREIYIVINDVTLVRADDGTPINCTSLTLGADVDSWAWSWRASISAKDQDKLTPGAGAPACELLAHVNGGVWRVFVESMQRDREFGRTSLTIGGRSVAAVWDDPYAAQQVFSNAMPAQMQQLAIAALATNGVPSEWLIDWQVPDWLVPAGIWSHQGTPMSAICRIAEAAGGYEQSAPAGGGLIVRPRYPAAPWAWGGLTPDIELPAAVVRQEGIEWRNQAIYNRVFVSGSGTGGVLGRVTRGGTAGDLIAPMITDPLCTDVQAARARALPVLSDVGRQALVKLRLPVLAETGVIVPGQLVQYVDGEVTRIGLTRSVDVQAGRPQVWQTIGVQTYE